MVYFVEASSLNYLKSSLGHRERLRFARQSTAISGLSLNPYSKNPLKIVQNLVKRQGVLRLRSNLVIWHDTINNSLTKHRSNYNPLTNKFHPLTPSQLVEELRHLNNTHKIEAIVYTRREGTRDIYDELNSSGILVIDAIRDLISSRKRKDIQLKYEIAKVHPDIVIEKRLVNTIIRNKSDLTGLKKSRKKRLSYKNNKKSRIESDQSTKESNKKLSKKQKDRLKKRIALGLQK